MISQFLNDEDGQTLVEYGLLISLIALALVTATALLGGRIRDFYGNAANKYPSPGT